MSAERNIAMVLESKETQGCWRYRQDGGERVLDTVYIRKSALGLHNPPRKIVVSIKTVQ